MKNYTNVKDDLFPIFGFVGSILMSYIVRCSMMDRPMAPSINHMARKFRLDKRTVSKHVHYTCQLWRTTATIDPLRLAAIFNEKEIERTGQVVPKIQARSVAIGEHKSTRRGKSSESKNTPPSDESVYRNAPKACTKMPPKDYLTKSDKTTVDSSSSSDSSTTDRSRRDLTDDDDSSFFVSDSQPTGEEKEKTDIAATGRRVTAPSVGPDQSDTNRGLLHGPHEANNAARPKRSKAELEGWHRANRTYYRADFPEGGSTEVDGRFVDRSVLNEWASLGCKVWKFKKTEVVNRNGIPMSPYAVEDEAKMFDVEAIMARFGTATKKADEIQK